MPDALSRWFEFDAPIRSHCTLFFDSKITQVVIDRAVGLINRINTLVLSAAQLTWCTRKER